jgi:hypothetical protein
MAVTAQQPEAYVWAGGAERAPDCWFPASARVRWRGRRRRRPRRTVRGSCVRRRGRVHAIEYSWLEALRSARLFAYRFDASAFRPFGSPAPHAVVASAESTLGFSGIRLLPR